MDVDLPRGLREVDFVEVALLETGEGTSSRQGHPEEEEGPVDVVVAAVPLSWEQGPLHSSAALLLAAVTICESREALPASSGKDRRLPRNPRETPVPVVASPGAVSFRRCCCSCCFGGIPLTWISGSVVVTIRGGVELPVVLLLLALWPSVLGEGKGEMGVEGVSAASESRPREGRSSVLWSERCLSRTVSYTHLTLPTIA